MKAKRMESATSISSGLLMCGGGVRSILLLHPVARCLETLVTVEGRGNVLQRALLKMCFFKC